MVLIFERTDDCHSAEAAVAAPSTAPRIATHRIPGVPLCFIARIIAHPSTLRHPPSGHAVADKNPCGFRLFRGGFDAKGGPHRPLVAQSARISAGSCPLVVLIAHCRSGIGSGAQSPDWKWNGTDFRRPMADCF